MGGGGIGMFFLNKEAGQDFPCNFVNIYFCKLIKYRYVHVHIMYMLIDA